RLYLGNMGAAFTSMEDAVTQTQQAASGVESGSVTLDCAYETSASYYWKLESLIFLSWQHSGGTKRNEAGDRFSVNLEKSKSSVSLRITALELGDAAIYFCRMRSHGWKPE
uniref:Ig-like domain-containing protein n=1 Tax=Gopherus agassizii TaxID=38772 RepID=A0A452H0Q3_9SAUR